MARTAAGGRSAGDVTGAAFAGQARGRAVERGSWRSRQAAPLGIHCAIAGIALPSPASVALHERLGFVRAGHFHEIGMKFGRWVDVGYWERRFPEVRATRG